MNLSKRKHDEEYLKLGFPEAIVKGQVVPKCVICLENFSNDASRPNRFLRYLRAKHPGLQYKNLEFFEAKEELF